MISLTKCSTVFLSVTETLPDALRTGCEKCSEKQKAATDKVIRHVVKNRARDWERLAKKYDPSGEFRSKYEDRFDDIRT